jgi:hypothetical protein
MRHGTARLRGAEFIPAPLRQPFACRQPFDIAVIHAEDSAPVAVEHGRRNRRGAGVAGKSLHADAHTARTRRAGFLGEAQGLEQAGRIAGDAAADVDEQRRSMSKLPPSPRSMRPSRSSMPAAR